jgi:hypothetical protein
VTDEKTIDEDKVRQEHEAAVHQPIQWLYLASVLIGGTFLMLVFLALLGSGGA